jgi:N6-adenosine-specific RNA methylase IME4
VAFVWVKTKADGITPIGAQGVRPTIVKPTTEFVLAASMRAKGRPLPLASESVRQVVLAPKREHSRKPDEVARRIEALYPHARKLEMFARERRPGWDAWGDDVDHFCA